MPSLKYLVGRTLRDVGDIALSRRWVPLWRSVPVGVSWAYDVQRFAGRRDLGCIIDAGANIGQTSGYVRRYFPRATIHAFEPVQATFRKLQERMRPCPNVRCVPSALGAEKGTAVIPLREDSQLNSLVLGDFKASGSERVEIETLDGYCQTAEIGHIDILKMDVQGYELEVLRGSGTLLARRAVSFVYAEVGFSSSEKEMQLFAPLHEELERRGFALSGFYEPYRWGPAKRFLGFCNALYVNPDALGKAPF